MLLITSTNGTPTRAAWNKSGRMLSTAPISKPPALLPSITRRSFDPKPCATRYSAQAMKSVKVLFLCIMRPSSCQALPISPPPRMCATAATTPRSTMLNRLELKLISMRSEEHTSELQSRLHLVCRLLLEKKKKNKPPNQYYIE